MPKSDETGSNNANSNNVEADVCAGKYMGQELYRVEDGHGVILVTQRGDKRVLSFGSNFEQSTIYMSKRHYLSHEYTQIMLLGLLFVEAKNITLLGLGGGVLAHCLHHYYPQCNIQVAELRQSVIDVAYDWFALPKAKNLKVHCSDAHAFLKTLETSSTDLIMSDLYMAEGMSEVQAQIAFINSAFRSLSSMGCLVINFHQLPESESLLMQEIQNIFDVVYVCDVFKGNKVMFCCKGLEPLMRDELKDKAQSLIETVEMPLMYYVKQLHTVLSLKF
jgi:spermidine synthase